MKKMIVLIGMVMLLMSATTVDPTDVKPSGLFKYSEVVIGNRDTSVLYFDGGFQLSDELSRMWESGRFSHNKPVTTYVLEHDSFIRLSWRSKTIHVTK